DEIAKQNNLTGITIFTEDGKMTNVQEFNGIHRYEIRRQLEKSHLIKKIEPHPMKLGLCSRSKDVIEPRKTIQWFLKTNEMAKQAVSAVKTNILEIIPEHHKSTWYGFLDNNQ